MKNVFLVETKDLKHILEVQIKSGHVKMTNV